MGMRAEQNEKKINKTEQTFCDNRFIRFKSFNYVICSRFCLDKNGATKTELKIIYLENVREFLQFFFCFHWQLLTL